MKKFYTHWNGGKPFLVEINDNQVDVFTRVLYELNPDEAMEEKNLIIPRKDVRDISIDPSWEEGKSQLCFYELCMSVVAKRIFIGKSPLNKTTKFSGGHGPKFDGNSILVQLTSDTKKNIYKYLFIGCSIMEFMTSYEIVKYSSPVGNNDVPYPYAIDTMGNAYLMTEMYMFKLPLNKSGKTVDPNDAYYRGNYQLDISNFAHKVLIECE
jgi:hypothetical protein